MARKDTVPTGTRNCACSTENVEEPFKCVLNVHTRCFRLRGKHFWKTEAHRRLIGMMEEKRGFQLSECPETNWGIVAMAGDGDEDRRATAFDSIVGTYYPVLLRYLKGHFRMSDDDAADCLQEFVLDKLIKKQIIQRASSEKGKFRYFLMRSIERFVLDRIRRRKAAKRAPNEMTICFGGWMKDGQRQLFFPTPLPH